MALKTRPDGTDVLQLLDAVEPEQKRSDCYELTRLMTSVTGEPAVVWGGTMVGFGRYKYMNTSKKEAEWFVTGFSPRKQNITLYLMSGFEGQKDMLKMLGKCKTGKSCLYIDKLADVDIAVLEKMIAESVAFMRKRFG